MFPSLCDRPPLPESRISLLTRPVLHPPSIAGPATQWNKLPWLPLAYVSPAAPAKTQQAQPMSKVTVVSTGRQGPMWSTSLICSHPGHTCIYL